MRRFLLTCALAIAAFSAVAQIYFNERYQNPRTGKQIGFTSVAVTDSGFVAYGGYRNFPTDGDNGIVLRFLTSSGQPRQSRYYPGLIESSTGALHRLPGGGYIGIGQWVDRSTPNPFALTQLLRFNALGDTLWTRRYLHGRTDGPITMCVLPDGGFAVAGFTGAPTPGFLDILLARFDANGNRLWWRTYNSQMQSEANYVAPTADGGFLLGAANDNLQQVNSYAIKTDSLGNEEWHLELGSPLYDDGALLGVQILNGNYLFASTIGKRLLNGNTRYRHILYWVSPQGQLLRQREFGNETEVASPLTIHRLSDGSVVVAGQQTDGPPNEMPEGFIYKLCPDGDSLLWFRTYKKLLGPDSHNYLRDLRPTPDGGFVGAGFLFSYPPDTGAADGWVFKIDSAGYLQPGGAPVTVQCRPITGTAPEKPAETPIDLYPNPTGPDGRFSLDAPPGATLTLTDALGRQVWRKTHLALRTSDLELPHPGLYLLRLAWPDGRQLTRKLLRP